MAATEIFACAEAALVVAAERRTVLLVDDCPSDLQRLSSMIAACPGQGFCVAGASTLEHALERLFAESFTAVVLGLRFSDPQGMDALKAVRRAAPDAPIVVVTSRDDLAISTQAILIGAQECLAKGFAIQDVLLRAVHHAIARKQVLSRLAADACTDELTGLCNRRGFFFRGRPLMRDSRHGGGSAALFFFDVDGLKPINDQLGHKAGDLCLQLTAELLRRVCRQNDVAARLGGDEFALLATEISHTDATGMLHRICAEIDSHNANPNRPFDLAISAGVVSFRSLDEHSLEEALALADQRMYEQKRARKQPQIGGAPAAPIAFPMDALISSSIGSGV